MEQKIILFHGSQQIIEAPKYGAGKMHNDYGRGFYCTEDVELAKEWACPVKNDGYANKYCLSLDSMNIMRLTDGNFNILNWLAILLAHRTFDISSPVGNEARKLILERFLPDTSKTDIIIGYRADDSYFSFAEDFVNNTISLRDLSMAMQLGTLGEQFVLVSERAFRQIEFLGYEIADHREYYARRMIRDQGARQAYRETRKNLQQLMDDIFVLDIIREGMKNDDPRLQCNISG